MRRLVSVRVFYILGGGYIAYGKEGEMYCFSLATCLFLALIACVRETKKVSDFLALIFWKLLIPGKCSNIALDSVAPHKSAN